MARDNPREGDLRLSGKTESGNSGTKAQDARRAPSSSKAKGDQVTRALKSVYDDTLREDIPAELRDLLGKLD